MIDIVDDFFSNMLSYFPQATENFYSHISEYGERLNTVILEDVLMPEVLKAIKVNDVSLLTNLFSYFEELAMIEDLYLTNLLTVCVLEKIGEDDDIFNMSKKYMGPKLKRMQIEADRGLGIVRDGTVSGELVLSEKIEDFSN